MKVIEDTMTKLMATNITKCGDRLMHKRVETTWKELTKKAAAIKTRYDAFPLAMRFGYAAAIILTAEYKHITNPTVTPADAIFHAAKELTEALNGNVPGSLGETSIENLARVEQIFAQK